MRTVLALVLACLSVATAGCTDHQAAEPSTAVPSPTAVPLPVASSTRPGLPPLRPRVTVRGETVPWERVGADWHLVVTSQWPPHGETEPEKVRFQLLSPRGRRTDLAVMDRGVLGDTNASPSAWPFPHVEDFSAVDRTVLLLFHSDFRDATAVSLDLVSGDQRRAHVPPGTAGLVLRKGGFAYVGFAGRVVSVDWDGATADLGRTDGVVLPLPDRSGVVAGNPLRVLGFDGERRVLAEPGGADGCRPQRWWTATTLLVTCSDRSLWLVPVDGTLPTLLTGPPDRHGTVLDFGAYDAVRLADGTTYVQKAAGCGSGWLARRNPDGSTTNIDGTREQRLVGAVGNRLVLQRFTPCGMAGALVLLDPVTRATDTLLRPGRHEVMSNLFSWEGMPAQVT